MIQDQPRTEHISEMPTTRPSDFPEADLWPASIRCREHANLRPKPNGLLIRDYVRDGDFTTMIAAHRAVQSLNELGIPGQHDGFPLQTSMKMRLPQLKVV